MRLVIASLLFIFAIAGCKNASSDMPANWPPQLGALFPDIRFLDASGATFQPSKLKGKVVLVEMLGMPCGACQAWSGAGKYGPYGGGKAQGGLDSIHQYVTQYGHGVQLTDPRIELVQILLYSMKMDNPTPEDARNWAKHFHLDGAPNVHVIVPEKSLISTTTYNLIPGFMLLDKQLIVRADSTGHNPKDNLYNKLLPMIRELL